MMPTIGTPVATNALSGALLTLSYPCLPDYGKWILTYCFDANGGTAEYNCKIVLISSLLWRNYDYQNSINVIENIAFSSGLKKKRKKKTF